MIEESDCREFEALLRGIAEEIASRVGGGFDEDVYRTAVATGLRRTEGKGYIVREEVPMPIHYLGEVVGIGRADLVVYDRCSHPLYVVEMKRTTRGVNKNHRGQAKAYDRMLRTQAAYVMNFPHEGDPEIERVA